MGASRKTARKRPVYVNGEYCESMAEGAREISRVVGSEVLVWQIQRVLNGKLKISGVEISETPSEKPEEKSVKTRGREDVLLRYPFGENPLDRGLPVVWR